MSVVPTSQCLPHGITNSTLFSVRRINPVSRSIFSRGTTRWTPFDARTVNGAGIPAASDMSSLHTPVAAMTVRARTSISAPLSRSTTFAPTTRSPSRSNDVTRARVSTEAPCSAAVRAMVIVWRASSTWAS